MGMREAEQWYRERDNDRQLHYYHGLNDGINMCNQMLIALVEGATKSEDLNQIRLVIATSASTIADIMQETSSRINNYISTDEKGE